MSEYICLVDTSSEIQKKLNQWRHDYSIEILGYAITDNNVSVLLKRTKLSG